MTLSNEEILRYSRHLILPDVGMKGQEKLKAAKVLLIGSGGLGTPNAMYLAAAGVGTIGLVDFDVIDHTNLQRQLLYSIEDVGQNKVDVAKRKLNQINPNIDVITFNEMLTSENALRIIKDFDIVIDGTDNFQTRYLSNDACFFLKKPLLYGSIFRFDGQVTVFKADEGPCYRCINPDPPSPGSVPSCAEGGVLGVLPGLVGMIQATEAVKLILGYGKPLIGRFLQINARNMTFREIAIHKDPDCPLCGTHPTVTGLIDYLEFCGLGRGAEVQDESTADVPAITPQELKAKIDREGKDAIHFLDVREPHEFEISHFEGAKFIPLGEIMARVNELDTSVEYVVHCRSGVRSAKAIKQLQSIGFKKLLNLTGGINGWADVDSTMPKY